MNDEQEKEQLRQEIRKLKEGNKNNRSNIKAYNTHDLPKALQISHQRLRIMEEMIQKQAKNSRLVDLPISQLLQGLWNNPQLNNNEVAWAIFRIGQMSEPIKAQST